MPRFSEVQSERVTEGFVGTQQLWNRQPEWNRFTRAGLEIQLSQVESQLAYLATALPTISVDRRWYSTAEVAEMKPASQYTVQERWCNCARIECSHISPNRTLEDPSP